MKRVIEERGSTMIETIMYISILLVLGIVLAGYAAKALERYKTGRASSQVTEIRKIVLEYSAAEEDYLSLNHNKMLAEAGVYPHDLKTGKHALGGKFEIGPIKTETGYRSILTPGGSSITLKTKTGKSSSDPYLFFLKYEDIPYNACIELGTMRLSSNSGGDLDTLIISNDTTTSWQFSESFIEVSVFDTKNSLSLQRPYPTMSEITSACSKTKKNLIVWIFS